MTISQLLISNAGPAVALGGLAYLSQRGSRRWPQRPAVRVQYVSASPPIDRRLLIRRTVPGRGRVVTRDS